MNGSLRAIAGRRLAVYDARTTKEQAMNGVQFFTNDEGQVKSVLIDLDVWGDLWEDFYDVMLAESSKTGNSLPWEQVRAELQAVAEQEAHAHADVHGTD